MDTSAGAVMVSDVLPVTDPWLAEMAVLPVATPVASPVLDTVAVDASDELHATAPVMFWVEPSLYVPVACNCKVVPTAIEALAGVTAMDTRAGGFTVSVEEPLIAPEAALMTVLPTPAPLANPVLEIVATVVADELQFTDVVRFCVVPSL